LSVDLQTNALIHSVIQIHLNRFNKNAAEMAYKFVDIISTTSILKMFMHADLKDTVFM